jgi:hypothetical protein
MRTVRLLVVLALVAVGSFWIGRSTGGAGSTVDVASAEVSNAFWESVSPGDGGASSIPPESECKKMNSSVFRCYARWAPVELNRVFIYQADVNVYPDGELVVSNLTKEPEHS